MHIYYTDKYYDCTTSIITNQLRKRLAGKATIREKAAVWKKWINQWSQFTLVGLLRSNVAALHSMLTDSEYRDEILASDLNHLIPWPEEAITAYSVFSYTEQLDQSLVQYLRDDLGHWWSHDMHHIIGGMSKLPQAFIEKNTHGWNKDVHLYDNIIFNVTVNDIKFTAPKGHYEKNHVVVSGYYTTSGQPFQVEGDAVIVTTPLHIIRQIKFHATAGTEDFPQRFYHAIEDVWYGPSTKIMVQFRTKFWEKKYKIKGGFSKTNLPIGQIHYPTSRAGDDSSYSVENPGILLCYTWKSEALLFGSLDPQVAIREAVREIAAVHNHDHNIIKEEFQVGAVQAWYDDPAAQGAYVLLKPKQYENIRWLIKCPWKNIYFAGEGISFASGWIQGALESGLRAAYQFYSRNETEGYQFPEINI